MSGTSIGGQPESAGSDTPWGDSAYGVSLPADVVAGMVCHNVATP
ncbi:MAG: hypothetical protein U0Q21_07750 [Dermatophilaceae bacterium]